MEASDLVRMANQIAAYFNPYSKAEAIDGIAKHIHLFWDPRMRNAMKAHLDKGGEGLSPLFIEAAQDYYKGPKTPTTKPNVGQLNVGAAPAGLTATVKSPAEEQTTATRIPNKGATPSSTRGT
ncbi:MAG TPA: formate dehydrogenase subunit delta [Hyphomicrobium sp.]|nr:formate dehydrogenase subunit delta [Hyphomicrobium sp.]